MTDEHDDEAWTMLDRSTFVAQQMMDMLAALRQQCESVPFLSDAPACPVFGAMVLIMIDLLMNPRNEGAAATLARHMAQSDWPDKVEVRRRLDALFDGLGLVDDSHLMN